MRSYFAYIRVSTVKQGEHGSSLQEQRDAIQAYAIRHNLTITEWFEERETAAKQGRTQFKRMLGLLRRGKVPGVIFHKIDRGARNLKDWSVIQELTERAIDVRFVHETIDMTSNEGKLTGDFLAVIAAHYIRNLRDEVKKGIRGRLKQGLYPFRAPFGYLNQGGGKPKTPDPASAPFVRLAFELYATGRYSLGLLCNELTRRGCRGPAGKPIAPNRLNDLLRNPFYAGLIVVGTGETYAGVHEAIIPMELFLTVQRTLRGNGSAKTIRHGFVFRRLVRCGTCRRALIGERQKGHVYYRCHTRTCPPTSLREEQIDQAITTRLLPFTFSDAEIVDMRGMLDGIVARFGTTTTDQQTSIRSRLQRVRDRSSRLLDTYLDGTVDKAAFNAKTRQLLTEEKLLEQALTTHPAKQLREAAAENLELLTTLALSYEKSKGEEKREMLQITTSNLSAIGKNVAVELHSPYFEAVNLLTIREGEPCVDEPRTGVSSRRHAALQAFVVFVWEHTIRVWEAEHGGKNSQGLKEAA